MTTLIPRSLSRGLRGLFEREPFEDFRDEMTDLIRRFESDWNGGPLAEIQIPRMDVSESDTAFEVTMDIPGLTKDELDIQVRRNTLEVKGEHTESKEEQDKTWHRSERHRGAIHRTITLPADVDEAKATAECRNGVLTIRLPKTEKAQARKVEVQTAG